MIPATKWLIWTFLLTIFILANKGLHRQNGHVSKTFTLCIEIKTQEIICTYFSECKDGKSIPITGRKLTKSLQSLLQNSDIKKGQTKQW